MFNVSQNNTNMPLGSANGGFTMPGGVYNEFATPEVDDGKSTKRDTVKLFLVSALVLTILLAIASYFYASYLNSQVEAERSSLSNLDNNPNIVTFEQNLANMRDLSKKLKLLNTVNDSRVYISGMLLPILESVVESSRTSYVYFNRIDIKQDSSNSSMAVSVSGVAQDYLALSRQISNFKSGPLNNYFSNFKFLSLTLDPSGQVMFDITFNMNVSTGAYLNFLKDTNGGVPSQKNTSGTLFQGNVPANVFSAAPTTASTSSATIASTTSTSSTGN
jgi:hypothetical protein